MVAEFFMVSSWLPEDSLMIRLGARGKLTYFCELESFWRLRFQSLASLIGAQSGTAIIAAESLSDFGLSVLQTLQKMKVHPGWYRSMTGWPCSHGSRVMLGRSGIVLQVHSEDFDHRFFLRKRADTFRHCEDFKIVGGIVFAKSALLNEGVQIVL